MVVEKIISGGQTGADQGGLEAAKDLGLETGGTAPYGFWTEVGPLRYLLQTTYGLAEGRSGPYSLRTKCNVEDSDATIVFGNVRSSGSSLTVSTCRELEKSWMVVSHPSHLDSLVVASFRDWLVCKDVSVLNVAGNRESRNHGLQEQVRHFLVTALREG